MYNCAIGLATKNSGNHFDSCRTLGRLKSSPERRLGTHWEPKHEKDQQSIANLGELEAGTKKTERFTTHIYVPVCVLAAPPHQWYGPQVVVLLGY